MKKAYSTPDFFRVGGFKNANNSVHMRMVVYPMIAIDKYMHYEMGESLLLEKAKLKMEEFIKLVEEHLREKEANNVTSTLA